MAATPAVGTEHRRSRALDVLRGLTIGWLIVIVFTPTTGWRGHAEWYGWDHSDVYFPAFLFIAGAGLAHQTREKPMPWGRLVKRFVTLVLLGLLVNAWLGAGPDLSQLRIPGVLQRIAVVGLVGAVVAWACRRRWAAALALSLVLAFGWSLLLWQASSACPDHRPQRDPGCGTYLDVDVALFGESHVYRNAEWGHEPEGTMSTLGALATFLAGYSTTRLLARRRRLAEQIGICLALASLWALAAVPLLQLQPVAKRIWTGSFVAVSAAGCLVVLALLIALFDSNRARVTAVVAWPLVALGRNALVLWTALFFVERALQATIVDEQRASVWFVAEHGPTAYLLVFGGGFLAVASLMHLARWYVRL